MPKRPSARGGRVGGCLPASPSAVFLVGFMGAGKTTVGRIVAEQLGWEFTDLDECIESRQGRSVAAIFRDSGEAGFRDLEHAELRRLLATMRRGGKTIAALGGGAITDSRNLALLQRHPFPIVFLDASVDTLRRRCLRQARARRTQRPLLGTMAEFRERHATRCKHYRQATLRIGTTGCRPISIASQIIARLRLVPSTTG